MRISDWSSDVCSSDLFGKLGIATPKYASAPVLSQTSRMEAPSFPTKLNDESMLATSNPVEIINTTTSCRNPSFGTITLPPISRIPPVTILTIGLTTARNQDRNRGGVGKSAALRVDLRVRRCNKKKKT